MSTRSGELTELARDADAELIVVVGGDGSVNEVVNGVAGRAVELAVLANGTGRDFARTHGIPTGFDDAVRVALQGRVRELDLGRVTFTGGERYFANVSSLGMSGAVAQRANSMSKALGGRLTFFYALTREFLTWQNTNVRVQTAQGSRSGPMHDVVVANGRFHGGGMKLTPEAETNDGLFDVLLIGDVSKLDFVTTAPKLYRGTHVTHRKVEILRSAFVEVDADTALPLETDGELVGTTPARFEIVPAALRLRIPKA
jgi:YegS/Rv2252/BmrU family lipid kinase